MEVKFSELKGKVLDKINVSEDRDIITFITNKGEIYKMFHDQECCEGVWLEDINGQLSDIIGSEILIADESEHYMEGNNPGGDDSWTWTFYRLATKKGWVTLRWYGSSNGYYSESATLHKVGMVV